MPNSNTFSILPIKKIIGRYIDGCDKICDPFVRNSPFKSKCITNDLDDSIEADFNLDALEFLKMQNDSEYDMVLYDPPYSPRQVSESYRKMKKAVNMTTTQSSFWTYLKREISRIVKLNGIVISCGWNSGGIGKTLGFELEEILLVPHGGNHNDTIVTVERKIK